MLHPDETLALTQQDLFWVPDDVRVVDRPELLATSCPRDLLGLNQVQRTRGAPATLPGLVGEVQALHAGRRSRWSVCPLEPVDALERALAAGGYERGHEHDGYSKGSDELPARAWKGLVARPVEDRRGLLDWLDVADRAFGEPRATTEAEIQRFLAECTGPAARVLQVVACDSANGEPLSAGGMTLFPGLSFGFLWAGGTVPEARGRGAYSAVLAARAAFARARGIARVGLYARLETSAPIVARLGFARHGRMSFWHG